MRTQYLKLVQQTFSDRRIRKGTRTVTPRRTGDANSENVAGLREPNVHMHFIFRFEDGQGSKSFLSEPNDLADTVHSEIFFPNFV